MLLLAACGSGGNNGTSENELDADAGSVTTETEENNSDPAQTSPEENTNLDTSQSDNTLVNDPAEQNLESNTDPLVGSNSVDEEINQGSGENLNEIEVDQQPASEADNSTLIDEATMQTDDVELSPIGLLMDEIRRAAADPILTLNQKLASGEMLSTVEDACLHTFDPAFGEQLTSIDCQPSENSLPVYGSDLLAIQASLNDSDSCQSAVASGRSDDCSLQSATLFLPVVWVAISNPAPSQIGTVMPLRGARIEFNPGDSGVLKLQSISSLFPPFNCSIDIAAASLLSDDDSRGNCESEISQLINRLMELRDNSAAG